MVDIIKKFFRAIISFLFGTRAENASVMGGDVLLTPIAMADELCGYLKRYRHTSMEQIVESVSMHRFALMLRRKLYSMRRTCEASVFNAMYHDAVMFAGGIADNKSIDNASRKLSKALLDCLVCLSESDIPENGVAIYEVVFGRNSKRYCYKGYKNAFGEGQYVYVPVGDKGEIRVVRIVSVSDIDGYTGDYPADRMKEIISNAFLTIAVTEAMDKNNC